MKKIICFFFLSVFLSACTSIVPYYKPTIQQGNIVTPKQMASLKKGMSEKEVIALLGDPVLKPVFDRYELVYMYTNEPNREPRTEAKLILSFDQNYQLKSWSRS
jgi:outer membrane protein assembly factor BamE